MRIQLVFYTWFDEDGKDLCFTFPGTTFDAKIELHEDDAADLRVALAEGHRPVFYAVAVDPDAWRATGDETEQKGKSK